jgi:hypothetical protein
MTPHAPQSPNPSGQSSPDERLPYEAPLLIDRGQVSELTQSNGDNLGPDSAYS